jgi:xanthine dehydrogenase accessory factor
MTSSDPLLGPLQFIADTDMDCVLAVITETTGPTYRTAGAVMAIGADGTKSGSLSSGCIEADIAVHALQTLVTATPKSIRYGQGSPFIDLRLPCGGAAEILLLPRPNRQILNDILGQIGQRHPQFLQVNRGTGAMSVGGNDRDSDAETIMMSIEPRLAFRIFGNGVEATHFANLAISLGYDATIYSPDADAIAALKQSGCEAHLLKSTVNLPQLQIDRWTAIVLFFHDHDWEPAILQRVLGSDAFYIGAQGSQLARADRDAALQKLGVTSANIAMIKGPIGLIPSTRDPRTLAVSVLAEILAETQSRTHVSSKMRQPAEPR